MIHFIIYVSEHPEQFEWLALVFMVLADVVLTAVSMFYFYWFLSITLRIFKDD